MFLHLSVILFTGGVSVQGGVSVHGGVFVQGGLCLGGFYQGDPSPYIDVRAVGILLECILVTYYFPINVFVVPIFGYVFD